MKSLLLTILITCSFSLRAQLKNEKKVLVRNHVKSEIEKTCNGGCHGIYSGFDRRGNLIEWDFYRAGTSYKHVYNEVDNKLMTLWIDKIDTTQIDTVYPKLASDLPPYVETYDTTTRQLTKTRIDERLVISHDECQNPIKEVRWTNGEMVYTKWMKYDEQDRLTGIKTIKPKELKFLNQAQQHMGKDPIEAVFKRFKYNENGQVEELYTYFSDPCMGLANHFLYLYTYHKNGLINTAEAFEEEVNLAFTLEYTYEFYGE